MSKALALKELPFTGERLVTGNTQEHIQIVFEHLHRYLFAAECCRGREVLDIACGEGYGSNLLAQSATKVIGIDIAAVTVRHAAKKYRRDNLSFAVGNCADIPMRSHSIDAVVSFETIEHIFDHEKFLQEIKRVLRPKGLLIISSPDKAEYSERTGQRNPFHVAELYRRDFLNLMARHFTNCRGFQQRLVGGSYIAADHHRPEDGVPYGTFRGDFQGGTFVEGVHEGMYALAVCSDGPMPVTRSGVFENRQDSAQMWHAFESIRNWQEQLRAAQTRAEELDRSLSETMRIRERIEMELRHTQREMELVQTHAKWLESRQGSGGGIQALPAASESFPVEAQTAVAALKERIAALEDEVAKRGEWGQRLDKELNQLRLTLGERETAMANAAAEKEALLGELAGAREQARTFQLKGSELDAELAQQRTQEASMKVRIAALEDEVAKRGERGQRLDKELNQLRLTLGERETAMANAAAEKEALLGELAGAREQARTFQLKGSELDAELAQQRTQEASMKVRIAALEDEVAKRGERGQRLDKELNQLRLTLGERETALATASQRGIRAEEERKALEEQLATAQDQVRGIMDELGASLGLANSREMQLKSVQTAFARLDSEFHECARRAEKDEKELYDAGRRLAYYEDKVRRMQGSFSWKATTFLRAIRRWLFDK